MALASQLGLQQSRRRKAAERKMGMETRAEHPQNVCHRMSETILGPAGTWLLPVPPWG